MHLFHNQAGCATCHQSPLLTDVLSGPDRTVPFLHDPAEVGMDPRYAARTATGKYRTTPLRGLWQHAPYFHDGRAPTLEAAVAIMARVQLGRTLSQEDTHAIVQFLHTLTGEYQGRSLTTVPKKD